MRKIKEKQKLGIYPQGISFIRHEYDSSYSNLEFAIGYSLENTKFIGDTGPFIALVCCKDNEIFWHHFLLAHLKERFILC